MSSARTVLQAVDGTVARKAGRTVVVTRPQPQASEWVERLQAAGVPAVAMPLLAIQPAPDPGAVTAAWIACRATAERAALPGDDAPLPPALMFVSANAVIAWHDAMPPADGTLAAWPPGALALATGPGTVRALLAAGVPEPAIVAPPPDAPRFDSEALWARAQALGIDWRDRPVWIVRGQHGRDWFSSAAAAAGARVQGVAAYVRHDGTRDPEVRALLEKTAADPSRWLWHFTSSESVDHLAAATPSRDWSGARALASHPRIAQAAREAGFGRVDLVGVAIDDVVAAARGD